jgi:hypothetical protein
MERSRRNAFILIEANVVCLDALFSCHLLTIVESCYVARLALKLSPYQTISMHKLLNLMNDGGSRCSNGKHQLEITTISFRLENKRVANKYLTCKIARRD